MPTTDPQPSPALSIEQYDALQLIRQAALVGAEDIRFTAYRPADEVGIRFKLTSPDGRPKFITCDETTYRGGLRLIRTICGTMCTVCSDVVIDEEREFLTELAATFVEQCGLARAHVQAKGIRDGFVLVLTLEYPQSSKAIGNR